MITSPWISAIVSSAEVCRVLDLYYRKRAPVMPKKRLAATNERVAEANAASGRPRLRVVELAVMQEAMESAALDGAVSRGTSVPVLIDMDAVADGAVSDPAAVRKIRRLCAISRSGVDIPSPARGDADDGEPVVAPALPSIAQFPGARDVEPANRHSAVNPLASIEVAIAEKQLFDPETAVTHQLGAVL